LVGITTVAKEKKSLGRLGRPAISRGNKGGNGFWTSIKRGLPRLGGVTV